MDFGDLTTWSTALYWWIVPLVMADTVFPPTPSEMLVVTSGSLAAEGHASLPLALGLAALGSFLGDMAVFLLFKRRLAHLMDRWRFTARLHAGIHRALERAGRTPTYGAIIGLRFLPGGRLALTAGSGIAEISTRSFAACSAAGSLLWASWMVGLGYVTGQTTHLPFWVSSLLGLAAGLLVGTVLGLIVTRRRRRSP
ncbi:MULTISPECIES: VTT domain-containing protein [Arthrobacter]|uniref:VTT domain-containing protein n=2 Tax=Arthrobacter TaxID=1663 RepID=A0ABU9KHZ7_9MICC|nr:VTT domain-containing protein [Arthrobacter sp. YJM1]MDP5226587.1 VTT domain-containing protein [Arthrobacter sp. YJM1]